MTEKTWNESVGEYFPLKELSLVWKENDQKQLFQVNFTYYENKAILHK